MPNQRYRRVGRIELRPPWAEGVTALRLAAYATTCHASSMPHSGTTVTFLPVAELGIRQRNRIGSLPVLRNWWTSLGATKTTSPAASGQLAVAVDDRAAAGEHVDFVLVVVEVLGRVAAGGDFELAHGEGRGVVLLADQPADAAAGGAFHGDFVGGDFV